MKKLLVVFSAALLFLSCRDRNYDCPIIDEGIVEFFPYMKYDTVSFQSGSSVKNIAITHASSTEPYICTESGGFMKKECDCERSRSIYGQGDSTALDIEMIAVGTGAKPYGGVTIWLGDLRFEVKMVLTDKWYFSGEITEGQNIQVGNINYPSVAIYEADTIANPQLKTWKVMIVRGEGIVKFFERLPNKEWTKI